MSSSMLLIGKSGAAAARAALELTAQNIANSANENYARRALGLSEVASTGGVGLSGSAALSGVRADRVTRTEALFLQTEARRTGADLARSETALSGLRNVESAIEQAGIFSAIVGFEAALSELASDPLDGALRANVVENARTLTQTFAIATNGIDIAAQELQFGAADGVARFNTLGAELARTNIGLARAQAGSSNKAALLDRRDSLLRDMAQVAGIATQFDDLGRVSVRLSGSTAAQIVSGGASAQLAMQRAADQTLRFLVDGRETTLDSGTLAGQAHALGSMVPHRASLDDAARLLIDRANDAQAAGTTPAGAQGTAFFSGSDARNIGLALTDGAGIATAPSGSPAGSRNVANLDALRAGLAGDGPAEALDRLLFTISSGIEGRTISRDALRTIAETAAFALDAETGVDLDMEAANLVRFQQAFQASGRVIQTAADIFDTILGIR